MRTTISNANNNNSHNNNTDDFFDFPVDMTVKINEYLLELDRINYQVAELQRIKGEIEKLVLQETRRVEYDEEGNITNILKEGKHQHIIGKYKVVIKTEMIPKINKADYEVYKVLLSNEFNPVKTSISYRVDNKTLNNVRLYGSKGDNETVDKFLSFGFAKPNVSLGLNV